MVDVSLSSSFLSEINYINIYIIKVAPRQFGSVDRALCWHGDQSVLGSIPIKGTYLGCRILPGPGPGWGSCRRQPINVFLSLQYFSVFPSLSLPLSLKINGKIPSGED
ncbi:unnamed protein product [Pipistrellus nathusii]|uniref:Uncharacterized protein n=1 Tax=Pipistrellus nathusii TaxID=59473 RepID=A0ABN9ZBD1_PIPNA